VESRYDALILISFGGPEGREDVLPFLERVLEGRNVPKTRMLEVAEHYFLFDGVSPINAQNRQLVSSIAAEFDERGPDLPVYWGNRNWHPLLEDTLRQMSSDGVRRALAFVTSAFSSYSSCRQYLEDIEKARAAVGMNAPKVDKLRVFYNHPGFVHANAENVRAAYTCLEGREQETTPLLFSAHSIPQTMADGCEYVSQLQETAALVAHAAGRESWELVYQSRSGPPTQPWLEPGIEERVQELAANGVQRVVVSPIGFVSDHMEVVFDLDTELQGKCEELGVQLIRAGTVGTHPKFVSMIRELVLERLDDSAERHFLGTQGVGHDYCPADCCSGDQGKMRPSKTVDGKTQVGRHNTPS
jgi:ferrochelatase